MCEVIFVGRVLAMCGVIFLGDVWDDFCWSIMCAKGATLSANGAAMSANDANMFAKEGSSS